MDNSQIIKKSIEESKKRIQKSLQKDMLIIFFTRIIEDLNKHKNPNFYNRIKDIFFLIYPYSDIENTKEIFNKIKSLNPTSKDGLQLDSQEKIWLKNFLDSLDNNCKLKNIKTKEHIEKIQKQLIEKYLPNSSKLIEPYVLGKLISSVNGIKALYRLPSSTIQLIGAEKALFRHMSKKALPPKYGLLYYSKKIQEAENKGKSARQLANKLAISIKLDYFKKFAR